MPNEEMERLAREYRTRLENRSTGGYGAAIDIVETQLELTDALICNARQQPNYALAYFRALKSDTLGRLYTLDGSRPVPNYRNLRRAGNSYNRLVDLQIELLTELDGMDNSTGMLNEIFRNENRALSLLGIIRGSL